MSSSEVAGITALLVTLLAFGTIIATTLEGEHVPDTGIDRSVRDTLRESASITRGAIRTGITDSVVSEARNK